VRKQSVYLLIAMIVLVCACARKEPERMVFIKGGKFINTKSNLYGKNITLADFYIGRYEITQKEWNDVMGGNPSEFKGDNLPVENVNWYDCIEYCNKRSIKEGFTPCYNIDKNKKDPNNKSDRDTLKWTVTINAEANGYRLPIEAEWEYAAGGGQMSKSYIYSGSDNIDEVAWFWQNSGDKPLTGFWNYPAVKSNNCKSKTVGIKAPNELGLYDMSGNAREWCEDWYGDTLINMQGEQRVVRGGGWLGGDFCCESAYRLHMTPDIRTNDLGLRVCRSK
jgi:sulfatase modifying factor 1